jgi:hypothetical protein
MLLATVLSAFKILDIRSWKFWIWKSVSFIIPPHKLKTVHDNITNLEGYISVGAKLCWIPNPRAQGDINCWIMCRVVMCTHKHDKTWISMFLKVNTSTFWNHICCSLRFLSPLSHVRWWTAQGWRGSDHGLLKWTTQNYCHVHSRWFYFSATRSINVLSAPHICSFQYHDEKEWGAVVIWMLHCNFRT